MRSYGAIILAGGGATRLGGVRKPTLMVGGMTMLDRVSLALRDADPAIVVGPPGLPVPSGVLHIQEDPPGGGPVAAIGAAFGQTRIGGTGIAAIMAGDLPLLTAAAVTDLRLAIDAPSLAVTATDPGQGGSAPDDPGPDGSRLRDPVPDNPVPNSPGPDSRGPDSPGPDSPGRDGWVPDGAVFVDRTGRPQWLCGAWRTARLAERLDQFAAERGGLAGGSLRALFGPMRFVEVTSGVAGLPPFYDCDTEDDIRQAEGWLRR